MKASDLATDLKNVRETAPLIHNITNYVVMNNTANALLAVGASPVMAHAMEEVEDMVTIAGALVINIGTLSKPWVDAMEAAMKKASTIGKPIIFDPVGAGATPYRNDTIKHLLNTVSPDIIRGNASEIMALFNSSVTTKGVDSTHDSLDAEEAASAVSKQFDCTVVVSGRTDIIISGNKRYSIANGSPLMGQVTGMGCTATALIAAFSAVQPDTARAATSAMAVMGVTGELAEKQSAGPGTMQLNFLDMLHQITPTDLERNVRLGA